VEINDGLPDLSMISDCHYLPAAIYLVPSRRMNGAVMSDAWMLVRKKGYLKTIYDKQPKWFQCDRYRKGNLCANHFGTTLDARHTLSSSILCFLTSTHASDITAAFIFQKLVCFLVADRHSASLCC
jgi:hypothetical protein